MAEAVWLDGRVVDAPEATVSVFDRGFTVGDGVFQTLTAIEGRPFAVRRHLERLRTSAAVLGLRVPYADDDLRTAIEAVVATVDAPRARVRVTVTAGAGPLGPLRSGGEPTVVVAAAAMAPRVGTAAAITVAWPRNERGALAGMKVTSFAENVRALALAHQQGADEALWPTTTGLLSEGSGANVFLVLGGRLVTPPLTSGCLPGVTRELVLELTDAVEEDVPMAALATAEEVFLTSTGRDVQGVHRVDDRALSAPGPVTSEVAAAFAVLVARDLDP